MTQPSNNSLSLFKMLTALQWLALPTIAVMFATVWRQLPARLATHFDLANQPNGWMSREEALVLFLALATLFAITSTWICSRVTDPDPLAWSLIGLFYVILGTLIYAERSVLAFNLYGDPVNVVPVLALGMLSALLVLILAVSTRRGHQLPHSRVLAEESHSGPYWAVVLTMGVLIVAFVVSRAPIPGLRIALGIALLMMTLATAMAWGGFRYVFTPAGLEVHTLGFRVRSIAAGDIRSYSVDRWNWTGGYGIRGVGSQRAYVWCNDGVRIQTNSGQVFLGHPEPQRIVRDLDKVVQNRKASEGA
jgi:Domain of unknown function (DUF1648)